MNDVFMCHIAHSHYTVRALESIGSRHRIHLMDVSYLGELKHYAIRNAHVVYHRPEMEHSNEDGHWWKPPCVAESWNDLLAAVETEWAFHVGPDVLLSTQSLELFEAGLTCASDDVIVALTSSGDRKPTWDVWAGRPKEILALGGFDPRYRICGVQDEDLLVHLIKQGKRWAGFKIPQTHMDGGHKSRPDAMCNIPVFEEKWGFPLGQAEFWKIVRGGAA